MVLTNQKLGLQVFYISSQNNGYNFSLVTT